MNTPIKIQPTNNGGHLRGLNHPGVQFVKNTFVKDTLLALDHTIPAGGIVTLRGKPGLGKSVAARLGVDYAALKFGTDSIWLQATSLRQINKLTYLVSEAIEIDIDESRMWKTSHAVGDALAGRDLLIVIDEADQLSNQNLGELKDWHDHRDARWTLVLVGGVRLAKTLALRPEVADRVNRHVQFHRLTPRASTNFAAALHPRLAATGIPDLDQAHKNYVEGRPRRWAQLLKDCLLLDPDGTGGFDPHTISEAIRLRGTL